MSQPQSQRGRKVPAAKRNPLVPFYWAVGALLVIGATFLITFAARGGFGSSTITPLNVPVGRTDDGFWYKGNPDAPVTVIKYSDYQCPSCAYYFNNLGKIIQRDYIDQGKIKFVYHEIHLDSHQHAVPAAEAARCAGDQNQYWAMHELLMKNQDSWAQLRTVTNVFSGYAGQIGLNRTEFEACLSNGTHRAEVEAAGQSSIARGVNATPTFDVNGQLVNASELPSAIEAALRAAGQ